MLLDIYNYTNPAEVVKVVDGDTLVVITDFGVCQIKQRLRILEIDTPEKVGESKQIGLAVKQFVTNLFAKEKNVIVTGKGSDVYGRVLAKVTLLDGKDFSTILLENKLCKGCGNSRSKWTEEEINETLNSCKNLLLL